MQAILFKVLMFPLALLWRLGWNASIWVRNKQKLHLSTNLKSNFKMIVIGACQIGGAGKTPFALFVAQQLQAQGLRVAILSYALNAKILVGEPVKKVPTTKDLIKENWRDWGDESLWLSQNFAGDVWITRNRFLAWQKLQQTQQYDVVVSDDGIEDSRLFLPDILVEKWLLDWGNGRSFWDIFPLGSCRSLWKDHQNATRVFKVGQEVNFTAQRPINAAGEELPCGEICILCAIGDPNRFKEGLQKWGYRVQKAVFLRDHSDHVDEKLQQLLLNNDYPIVITSKDRVKLCAQTRQNQRIYTSEVCVFLSSPIII